MRPYVRRPILAGLVAVVAALLAAAPALAATPLSINSATASGPALVTVSATYNCATGSAAAAMVVLVVDVSALGLGQSTLAPTCDGLDHTNNVAVPITLLLPFLLTVRSGDLAAVTANLVDVNGLALNPPATAARLLNLT